MIRLLLADDHLLFLDGLGSLFADETDIAITGKATNGREVLRLLKEHKTDLVLLDVNMPVMDGLETTVQAKALYPDLKILILTMYNTHEFISNLVKAGADGYILKNTGKEELLKAVRQVVRGENYFSTAVTTTLVSGIRSTGTTEEEVPLSKREIEVLKLISQEFTTHEIADKLFLSAHTIDTHRKNLLSKLNVKNTAGLVRYAITKGLG